MTPLTTKRKNWLKLTYIYSLKVSYNLSISEYITGCSHTNLSKKFVEKSLKDILRCLSYRGVVVTSITEIIEGNVSYYKLSY